MRLSETKKQALYVAIHERVMRLRVDLRLGTVGDVDDRLYKIVDEIWSDQCKVLGLRG